jgi:Ca-activated chloride channel homolog
MFAKRCVMVLLLVPGFLTGPAVRMAAQDEEPNIHVVVDMVQLEVAVTDSKGNYLTGLNPTDFLVTEDGIHQKIATFGEGTQPARRLDIVEAEGKGGAAEAEAPKAAPPSAASPTVGHEAPVGLGGLIAGANVFILFDTSNYMYRGFVFAQDAISEFVRSLQTPDRIAFYSYSRDLSRASTLTDNRPQVLHGVRSTVAGDDAALYNALLMTLKDASQYQGKKAIVVFSNGPDNASMVAPEDVAELAQSEEIPIYMISTHDAKLDPVSTVVFQRISAATGGEAFFAKSWRDQRKAFEAIREDLQHLYSISYYPHANPNRGWRAINVKLAGEHLKKYHIRTRSGYRPRPAKVTTDTAMGQ